jgi:hypothetical protein
MTSIEKILIHLKIYKSNTFVIKYLDKDVMCYEYGYNCFIKIIKYLHPNASEYVYNDIIEKAYCVKTLKKGNIKREYIDKFAFDNLWDLYVN